MDALDMYGSHRTACCRIVAMSGQALKATYFSKKESYQPSELLNFLTNWESENRIMGQKRIMC